MTTTSSAFAKLLKEYRERAKKSQQELSTELQQSYGVSLYGSDISKLERGARKTPKIEYAIAMIKALQLTDEEAKGFLEAGEYPPSVLQRIQEERKKPEPEPVDLFPPGTEEQAHYYLNAPIPSWQLGPNGFITADNPLVRWLWMMTSLIGLNVFTIYTKSWNINRVLLTGLLNDFWPIKLQVLKWLERHFWSAELEDARRRIFAKVLLKNTYETLNNFNLDDVTMYQYTLFIQHPEMENHYLHFLVKIWITRKENGKDIDRFIVVFDPADHYTAEVIAQKHAELTASRPFPPEFPSLTYNKLWYITGENEAHKHLIRRLAEEWDVAPTSAKGKHMIELLYTEPLKSAIDTVGSWDETRIRVIKGFKASMQRHVSEEPELQKDYTAVIDYLAATCEGFTVEWFNALPPLQLPTIFPFPQYMCYIIEKLSPREDTQLIFDSYVQFPQSGRIEYLQALVPKDDMTKAILKQIEDSYNSQQAHLQPLK